MTSGRAAVVACSESVAASAAVKEVGDFAVIKSKQITKDGREPLTSSDWRGVMNCRVAAEWLAA